MEVTYIQVSPPNTERIAEIVKAIKGPNRTMAQLADACGVSPSTLSRLVNGKTGKPATQELLKKLFDQRDASCTVEYEELLKANGLVPRMERNVEEERERRHAAYMARRARYYSMQEQVKNGLLKRGVQIGFDGTARNSVSPIEGKEVSADDALLFGVERYGMPDMILKTIYDKADFFWGFEFITAVTEDYVYRHTERKAFLALDYTWRVIQSKVAYFLDSTLHWGIVKLQKISFVFADELLYTNFCTIVQRFEMSANVSAILLDTKTGAILQERNLSKAGGDGDTDLFKLKVLIEEQDCRQDDANDPGRLTRERFRQLSLFDDL